MMKELGLAAALAAACVGSCTAAGRGDTKSLSELRLPHIFGDNMVLQRGTAPVWGWAAPGETVTVTIAGQSQTATAGRDGKWMVVLRNLRRTRRCRWMPTSRCPPSYRGP